jgi:hypothetical protein
MEDLTASRELDVVKDNLTRTLPTLAARLSLFWTDIEFTGGRFPLLDRVDYLDHGLALLQHRPAAPERPTLQAIRKHLCTAPLRNWVLNATRLGHLRALGDEDHKAYLRALLYPARFICTWETGLVVSNDEAVTYVQKHDRLGSDTDLVMRALVCRARGTDLSELFSERYKLKRLLQICVGVCEEARADTTTASDRFGAKQPIRNTWGLKRKP